jgi:hypothetical protein
MGHPALECVHRINAIVAALTLIIFSTALALRGSRVDVTSYGAVIRGGTGEGEAVDRAAGAVGAGHRVVGDAHGGVAARAARVDVEGGEPVGVVGVAYRGPGRVLGHVDGWFLARARILRADAGD